MKNNINVVNILIILFSFTLSACGSSNSQAPTGEPDLISPAITVSSGISTFSENSGEGNFSIVLNSQPNNDVIINIESSDTTEASVITSQLTFDVDSWNIAQSVTLTGINDNNVDGNQTFFINLSIDSTTSDTTGYAEILPGEISNVSVTVTDDDSPGITLAPSQLSFSENGGSDQFEIILNTEPNGTVIVNLTSDQPAAMSFDINQVSFDISNWSTPQTITAIAIDNSVSSGNIEAHAEFEIDVTSTDTSGYNDIAVLPVVTVMLIDDDAPGFTLLPGVSSFSENSGTGSVNIVLNSQPDANVVLLFSSSNINEATVSNQTITFTQNNWDQQQSVNLLGVDDNLIDGTQQVVITASIESVTADSTGYSQLPDQSINVTVTDDDNVGATVLTPDGTTVTEASGSANSVTVSVALNTQPNDVVIIDLTNTNPDRVSVNTNQLTFTPSDWSTAQIITVSGIDNFIADNNSDIDLQLTINAGTQDTTGYISVSFDSVLITLVDNDSAEFILTGGITSFSENSGPGDIDVVLNSQPDNNVELTFTSGDINEVTITNPVINFTPQNWSVAQTVNLTGVNNNVVDGSRTIAINASVSSTLDTTGYAALVDQILNVTVVDDDTAGLMLTTPGGTSMTEATGSGNTLTIDVALNTQPNGSVVVDLVNTNSNELTIDSAQVTFTDSDWNIAQPITLSSIDDAVDDGDSSVSIQFSVNSASLDTTGYKAVSVDDAVISVIDNDTRNVVISPSSLIIDEGASDTFNVVLGSEPTSDVIVNFAASTNSDEITLASALTFNSTNWNVAQPYTVSIVDDQILDGDVIVSLSVSITTNTPSEYTGLSIPAVNVTATDTQPVPTTLFNAGTSNGNLGGRAGADATCASVAPTIQACTGKPNVHAFLSTSVKTGEDNIQEMPLTYGYNSNVEIQGPTGIVVSSNWSELFTTPSFTGAYLQTSLSDAAVLPAGQIWWSGSLDTARIFDSAFFHCSGYTTAVASSISYVGTSSNTDRRWLNKGVWNTPTNFITDETYTCANTTYLLCACGN